MSRLSEDCDNAFVRERCRGSWASGGYGTYHRTAPSRTYNSADEYVRVVSVEAETDKAWLLRLSSGARAWFPKSVCRVAPNGEGMLYLRCPAWLWRSKKVPGGLRGSRV